MQNITYPDHPAVNVQGSDIFIL